MGLILVVSEDPVEIETIKTALSVHGWWVTVAADSETALQVAADQAPKLVVVDSDLPGSLDLLRSFGSHNGGPGVLSCVSHGFEGALEIKEAGGDEILTKPVSPEGVLEAVQRCIAAPRVVSPQSPSPAPRLMTTEEIFGDVLREIEEGTEGVVSEPAPAAPAPPAPPPVAASTVAEDLFEPTSDTEPVVSLAGLFDGPELPDTMAAAELSAPAPASEISAPSIESEWQGEERRSVDRPWSEPESLSVPKADELFEQADSVEQEEATPELLSIPSTTVDTPPATVEPPVEPPIAAVDDGDRIEQVEEDEGPSESEATTSRRAPLLIGSLAAALLMFAGVVFVLNRGSETATEPPPVVESIELAAEPVPEISEVVVPESPEVVGAPLPQESLEADAPEVEAPVFVPSPAESPEEIDLEAIVDEELERREEELRRVFLEEEKRLLRELNNLEPEEAPVDEAADSDGGDRDGVGR